MPDETRIDRCLCAVRLVKTRPMATQPCDGAHVRVDGNIAPCIEAIRDEGRPSKRLRRELERMPRSRTEQVNVPPGPGVLSS